MEPEEYDFNDPYLGINQIEEKVKTIWEKTEECLRCADENGSASLDFVVACQWDLEMCEDLLRVIKRTKKLILDQMK